MSPTIQPSPVRKANAHPPRLMPSGVRAPAVNLLTDSTLRVGRRGDVHVVKQYVPTSDAFAVNTTGLSNVTARVALDLNVAPPSALAIVGSRTLPAQPLTAELDHYVSYGGKIVVDNGDTVTLVGRDGTDLVARDALGTELRIDPRQHRLTYTGDVEVPFEPRATPLLSYSVAHVDGVGRVLVEGDFAASANTRYKLVLQHSTGEQVAARVYPEFTFANGVRRALTNVDVDLVLNETRSAVPPVAKMAALESKATASDGAAEGEVSGVITQRIATGLDVGPGEVRMVNFAPGDALYLPMELTHELKLDVPMSAKRDGGDYELNKLHPSSFFRLPKADQRRPAASYEIYEGNNLAARTATGRYTEIGDEMSISGGAMRAVSANARVAAELAEHSGWQVVQAYSQSGTERQERTATYDVSARVQMKNVGDHDRVLTPVFGVGDFDQGIDNVEVSLNGVALAPDAFEVDAKAGFIKLKVSVEAQTPAEQEPVLELKLRGTKRESRTVPISSDPR